MKAFDILMSYCKTSLEGTSLEPYFDRMLFDDDEHGEREDVIVYSFAILTEKHEEITLIEMKQETAGNFKIIEYPLSFVLYPNGKEINDDNSIYFFCRDENDFREKLKTALNIL